MSRKDALLAGAPTLGRGPKIRPGGIGEYFEPDGSVKTVYASTCAHCQHITEFESRRQMTDAVDVCRSCMRLICLECVGKPCMPAEKWAEFKEKYGRPPGA